LHLKQLDESPPESREKRLTWALAHNKTPPIGANMMPITKKSGKTDLGVKIGLRN
jgi:hypothetical protein